MTIITMRIVITSTALLLAFAAGFLVARLKFALAPVDARLAQSSAAAPAPQHPPARTPGNTDAPSSPVANPAATPLPYPALRAAALLATKRLQIGVHVPPFMFEKLNPDFSALYELSPSEIKHFEAVLQRTRAQVATIEAAKAQVAPQPDGTIRITIEPYPREGGAILDALRAEVLATLGEERSEFFRSLSDFDSSNSTEFGGFGLRQTVVEVRALGPNGPGSMRGSTSFDPATSLQTMTTETDFRSLKDTRPELYARLVQAGLAH